MWNEIKTQEQLKEFMESVFYFHDSCLKEFKYLSGAYVKKETLAMHPINEKRILKVIIQRQFKDMSVIEMEFSGLKHLNFYPVDDFYTCEILDSKMILKDDCFYWCDDFNISEDDFADYKGTLICAEKFRWRVAEEYLGEDEMYK